jgi:WD40 repeat protein
MARVYLNPVGRRAWFAFALLVLWLGTIFSDAGKAQDLYDQPMLVIDQDMHSASIRSSAVAGGGQFAVTGSDDKTVRIWSLADGELLRTIRMPSGPGNVGQIYAVAVSPDGDVVAAAGWTTESEEKESIYLLDPGIGNILRRIEGLDNVVNKMAFSADGRYLAVAVTPPKVIPDKISRPLQGLRVFDRDTNWDEVFRDTEFDDYILGISFSADYRLAVASYDGKIRLYSPDPHLLPPSSGARQQGTFSFVVPPKIATSAEKPHGIAFSPDGSTLAVGYADAAKVDLLDGRNLQSLPGPNVEDLSSYIAHVAWSGTTLVAAGFSDIYEWTEAGRGDRRTLKGSSDSIRSLEVLADGLVFVAAADLLKCLKSDGSSWELPISVRHSGSYDVAVSIDGTVVDFGLDPAGKALLRFDVRSGKLNPNPPADHLTLPPKIDGLRIERWKQEYSPTLNNELIVLDKQEKSRSLAIHPNGNSFVLGTGWALRAIDANNRPLWRSETPGAVSAINITGDGRLVVVQYDDGTIHWYTMDNGIELLALTVLSDKAQRVDSNWSWVAFTPDGYYASSPEARAKLQWYINDPADGFNNIGKTFTITTWPELYRPDVLPLVLKYADINKAVRLAELTARRLSVQQVTKARTPPGPRLHVLTVGINEYGARAKMHLDFARQDSESLFSALKAQGPRARYSNTLGSIYSQVIAQNLSDEAADSGTIFDAFSAIRLQLERDQSGRDVAVIMFAGHGAVIENQFYLLQYGVDARTEARIRGTAIGLAKFQAELAILAKNHRVLVLLDACHSGAVAGDGTLLQTDGDRLLRALDLANVTVLTSSKGDQTSREDPLWQHGAFTKLLLDALSGAATDIQTDHGVITVNQLVDYLEKSLPALTNKGQQLGINVKFAQGIFIAGLSQDTAEK